MNRRGFFSRLAGLALAPLASKAVANAAPMATVKAASATLKAVEPMGGYVVPPEFAARLFGACQATPGQMAEYRVRVGILSVPHTMRVKATWIDGNEPVPTPDQRERQRIANYLRERMPVYLDETNAIVGGSDLVRAASKHVRRPFPEWLATMNRRGVSP